MTVALLTSTAAAKNFAVPADWISAAAYAPDEERRRTRLLRSHINRVDQRIARAADAEHDAVGVGDDDGFAGRRAQRHAYLRTRVVRDLDRFADDRLHFAGSKRIRHHRCHRAAESGYCCSRSATTTKAS